ncbi:MAG: bifunctional 5,10-methylenetetrahydrofolate dehydrogenase/5,10-methenyltetrahydrofolate cyclohydrolase [Candidatus Omnitrophica bacterium]|nr:bifunctional 5,10-methylenetetrahydrofolate dehydrogenase/5,10-methenyltetrahydrofolate cyclohydrolase [Candidatus Omnitrophota bacterium]MDD5488642.1 bifunctional 5,10-methylenetetrahydrofolate dehydrogenase/5,10-methenyltetrahydrofolate cyclohydrolase [Candidatus Omnitrophota bacterium]
MATIIDGREIARRIKEEVRAHVDGITTSGAPAPRLVSLSSGAGDDAEIYIKMQQRAAEQVGIEFVRKDLGENARMADMMAEVKELNADKGTTAIILQKPLPFNGEHNRIVACVAPEKDAEGLHPFNLGKILRKEADIVPCTPGAVMHILKVSGVELYGKEVVIVGHSEIVGKPLSLMMLNQGATTTVCHIATAEAGTLTEHTQGAEILVVAVGKAGLVKENWVSKGAVVVDVGINSVDGVITGDVDFEDVSRKASVITPVPGGVGPVTVAILMRNVLRAYLRQAPGASSCKA